MNSTSSINSKVSPVNQIEHSRNKIDMFETIRALILTSTCGVGVRYGLMPFEYLFTKRSFPENSKSYLELFQAHILNRVELKKLQTEVFTRTCLVASICKSVSNFGVVSVVEGGYSHLSSLQKGCLTIFFSTLLETITTTPGEWNKIRAMEDPLVKKRLFNAFRIQNLMDRSYHRALLVSLVRSSWSGTLTYGSIYTLQQKLKSYYPDQKDKTKVIVWSSLIGATLPQFLIMPGSNLQTMVFRNSNLSLKAAFKKFLKEYKVNKFSDVPNLSKGVVFRAIHRGTTYLFTFLFAEIFKKNEVEDV